MNKASCFFKSFVPLILIAVIQILIYAAFYLYTLIHTYLTDGSIQFSLKALTSVYQDTALAQLGNVAYAIIAIIVFGTWYSKQFLQPFRNRERAYPAGFSFHTIVALICLAVGLQYVTNLLVTAIGIFYPNLLDQYNSMVSKAGYGGSMSMALLLYTVLLAPVAEELIFRGLIFRFSRYALPFWLANIWQALLFGVMHMNLIQGIYAFFIGLFFGWICHRGRGIKYSIVLHIFFNILGALYASLFSDTVNAHLILFSVVGVVLTIFGLWLFHSDFIPESAGTV